jgi:hypothetical protein
MEHTRCGDCGLVASQVDGDELSELALKLASLLAQAKEPRWSSRLSAIADAFNASRDSHAQRKNVIRETLSLYGGMGSFQDLVLQDSRGVRPEQRDFDMYRHQLFELARAELQ